MKIIKSLKNNQSGNALVIGLIIAAVVIVGGGAVYFATKKSSNNNSNDHKATSSKSEETSNKQPASYKTLLANAKAGKYDVKCTYSQGKNTGTFYVRNDKKMRFETSTPKGMGYAIRLSNKTYVWNKGQSQGVLITDTSSSTKNNEKYSTEKYSKQPANYHLKCQIANNLSDSLFTPPSSVKFIDTSQYTSQMPQ